MDYRKSLEFIINRRRDDLSQADAFFKAMLASNPEFREAELNVRAAELKYVKGGVSKNELDKLRIKRDAVIKKLNIADKLNPPPHCPVCGDTGRTENGLCSCVKKLAISSRSDSAELPFRSFDEFTPELYPEYARPLVTRTAEVLRAVIEKGGDAKKKNICLIGKTGTGKTFLASCAVGLAAAMGRSVVSVTAFSFVDRALKYHTGFNENRFEHLSPLLDADVLFIDDLGTESILKNVTLEYLYHVVNERQLKHLTTIITSNLSVDEIAVRYGERIASRLFDKKLCFTAEFDFNDVRKIKLSD